MRYFIICFAAQSEEDTVTGDISGSCDDNLKLWNMQSLTYIQTLRNTPVLRSEGR